MSSVTGVPKKTGTQVNGDKTVTIRSNQLNLAERNIKLLNEIHTKNQVNQLKINVILGLMKTRVNSGCFGANSA